MSTLINENLIDLGVDLKTKEEVIDHVAVLMNKDGKLSDKAGYIQAVRDREAEISTNLGDGIGMPHARTNYVKEAGLVFLRLNNPIAWGEEAPVRIVFGIGVPDSAGDLHLKILAQLARKLIYDEFKQKLFNASSKEEVLALINEATGGLVQ